MKTNRIFVTGIGTGIGKTIASAVITEALGADYWKPVQAGSLDHTDTDTVRELVQNSATFYHPETYRLQEALSPHAAAAREGTVLLLNEFQVPQTDRLLVIEGAGGLLVPLSARASVADLILQFQARVILVSRHYLGSINHTLLTAEALKARAIPVLGILFNGAENPETETAILSRTGLRPLGRIDEALKINRDWVTEQALRIRTDLIQAMGESSPHRDHSILN